MIKLLVEVTIENFHDVATPQKRYMARAMSARIVESSAPGMTCFVAKSGNDGKVGIGCEDVPTVMKLRREFAAKRNTVATPTTGISFDDILSGLHQPPLDFPSSLKKALAGKSKQTVTDIKAVIEQHYNGDVPERDQQKLLAWIASKP